MGCGQPKEQYILCQYNIEEDNTQILNCVDNCKNLFKDEFGKEMNNNRKELEDSLELYMDNEKIPFSFTYSKKGSHELKIVITNINDNLKNISCMFMNCKSLIRIDLSNFNSNNIIDMSNLFFNCTSLRAIELNNFRTNNVYNIKNMFRNCTTLISVDLSSFRTNNAKEMLFFNTIYKKYKLRK